MIARLACVTTVETEQIARQVCFAICARQLAVEQRHQLAFAVKC